MIRGFLLTGTVALSLALAPIAALGQGLKAESEKEQTRLGKDEITGVMIRVSRVSVAEQNHKIDEIWTNQSSSKTPRSDFLFCAGLAYLGNYKAQACLGRAYENGIGIVQDPSEAYVWYSIALDNPKDGEAIKQKIEAEKDRVKQGLISTYPAPSDEDLAGMVEAQKRRMKEYQAEMRDTRR
jgi:hypothetical protein